MSTNRRDFIKIVVAGAVAAGCPVDLSLLAEATKPSSKVDSESNTICHQVRDGYPFSIPPVSKKHDVIIVGGGMSGMAAAYLMPNHDFLLLEKEPHFGGNAYEMSYDGSTYATGAAFVESKPAADLANELGLKPLPIGEWDGSIIKGEFVPDTWGEGLNHLPYPESVRESFKKLQADIHNIDVEKRMNELDNLPFSHFLKGYAPEVKLWWDTYGPSNWGTVTQETSAYVAIDEFQDFANPRSDSTWPGGLGALSAKLAETLKPKYGERMLAGATTIAVVPQGKEVQVTYIHKGELKTVAAKGVIMATPKFITQRLVAGLPEAQKEAMHKMRFAPYPVVNLIFDKPVFNKGYDTWCPGNAFTDIIVADWTVRNQEGYKQKYNIITCYTPMRESQRGELLTDEGAKRVARNVLRDFQKLFPGSDVDPIEVHIYRRGHPMFMAAPGNFTHLQPLARQPMERVFFANTDSEGPVSSTSGGIQAARRTVRELERSLAKGTRSALQMPVRVAGV
jgi:monoamine oxidase